MGDEQVAPGQCPDEAASVRGGDLDRGQQVELALVDSTGGHI